MDAELLARARTGFEAWQRGDVSALESLLAADVELLWWKPGDWDCHGREAVVSLLRERASQGGHDATMELIEAGDQVLVVSRRAKGRETTKAGDVSQLVFADARHGIALTNTGSGVILVTSNAGRSWSTTRLSISTDRPQTVTMEDASHALIIAYNQIGIAHSWTSSDGGKTWLRGADLPNREFYDSIARSGSLLCAVGLFGSVATSRDDGAIWSYDGMPAGYGLSSVQFVGSDTLMIGGSLGILTRNLTTAPLP
jgi:photosystem II stability/assembly factor-like uncharacterized protein